MNGEISKHNEFILQNLIEGKTILVLSADRKRHLENYMTFCNFIEDKKIYKVVYFNKSLELPNGSKVIFDSEENILMVHGIKVHEFLYCGNKPDIRKTLESLKKL